MADQEPFNIELFLRDDLFDEDGNAPAPTPASPTALEEQQSTASDRQTPASELQTPASEPQSTASQPQVSAGIFQATQSTSVYAAWSDAVPTPAAALARLSTPRWRVETPPEEDETWPQSPAEWKAWVARLYAAFIDTTSAEDAVGTQYLKWVKEGKWAQHDVEARCWCLVGAAKRLHEKGCCVPQHLMEKRRGTRTDRADGPHARMLQWGARLGLLERLMRGHKVVCSEVMSGEGVDRLVAAPQERLTRAIEAKQAVKGKRAHSELSGPSTAPPARRTRVE